MPFPNYLAWTKTTPQEKQFFWSNPYKIEVMITYFLTTIKYFWWLYTTFGAHVLFSTAIYYFWWLYTTFDDDGSAIPYCDFARIQVFPVIYFTCGLNTRLEFNINLLALIQFCFFCSLILSHVNFNLPFWKPYFIGSTHMLKMWNFQSLTKTNLDIFNWIKTCYSNCNIP